MSLQQHGRHCALATDSMSAFQASTSIHGPVGFSGEYKNYGVVGMHHGFSDWQRVRYLCLFRMHVDQAELGIPEPHGPP